MSTLREAIESGRRWRLRGWQYWMNPGERRVLEVDEAISTEWEIEPEPEKPREWIVFYWPENKSPFYRVDAGLGAHETATTIRIHDADACDRLHQVKPSYTGRGYTGTV